jgi:hypothetical protein
MELGSFQYDGLSEMSFGDIWIPRHEVWKGHYNRVEKATIRYKTAHRKKTQDDGANPPW